ncbi:MAG: replication initiation protein [Cetobacterium sp.]|uniref:replication initiation protein n=1 Tax=Cetobacterium sp. TaxID=2071632 RepID=UPI003EE45905
MDLVQYHNDINKLKLGNFTTKELDVFFSLLIKARDEKAGEITMLYSEIKELIKEEQNQARLTNYIRGVSRKLKDLNQEIELPNGEIVIFGLFDLIRIKPKEKKIVFTVNEVFRYMIDNLVGKYTIFDLRELISLKGSYPKNLFRLLKQWESEQTYLVKIEDFREVMGIPNTYLMKNIRQKVLKPCLEELENSFYKLELIEQKKGRNVTSLKFTWKNRKEKKSNIIEIQPVKRKKATLGEKELQEHEKNQLENTIQELEKKKIVKESSLDPVVELKKISKIDYDNLYDEYLEKLGEEHNLYIRKSFDFINKAKYEIVEDMEREQPKENSLFSEKDIDESLLVSKTGRKLVGMARQHKIKKLLEEMNKRGGVCEDR